MGSIKHPVQLGHASTALSLLSYRNFHIGLCDQEEKIYVDERHRKIYFESEEELMMWLYEQVIETATSSLQWFKDKASNSDTTRNNHEGHARGD